MRMSMYLVACVVIARGGVAGALGGQCGPPQFTNHTSDRVIQHLAVHGDTVWIGTRSGGVSRYDTVTGQFTQYTRLADGLPDNSIKDVAVGPTGVVWAATKFALSFFDPNGVAGWQTFDESNSPLRGEIWALAVDGESSVWVGTDSGLFIFDGAGWQHPTPDNSGISGGALTSIAFDLDGDVWIGVRGAGVDRFDGKTWTHYTPTSTGTPEGCDELLDLPPDELGLMSTVVWVLGVNPITGDVWFSNGFEPDCRSLRGLTVFDGQNWRTYTGRNSPGSPVSIGSTSDVAFDGAGVPYFSAGVLYRHEDGVFSALPVASTAVVVDGDDIYTGSTFLGLDSVTTGLSRIRNNEIVALNNDTLPAPDVYDLAVGPGPDPEVWAATHHGVARWTGSGWEHFDTDNSGILMNYLASIAVGADGRVWVGTRRGLSVYDGVEWQTFTVADGLPCNGVRDIAIDHDGNVWLATGCSSVDAAVFDGETFTPIDTGLVNGIADIEVAPDGAVWLASYAGGASRFVNMQRTTYRHPSWSFSSIAFDADGGVWFGNISRVVYFDGKDFQQYDLPPELGRLLPSLAVDASGDLWVGRDNVARFDGEEWVTFGREDGLVAQFVHALVATDDAIWVGTGREATFEGGISVIAIPERLMGDMNCDGAVTVRDINPFVLAIHDEAAYCAQFPDCIAENADFNGDNRLSIIDINGFVAALTEDR